MRRWCLRDGDEGERKDFVTKLGFRWTMALLTGLLVAPSTLSAQYFGRNRVQYANFKFKIVQTQHFDVHYYDEEYVAAMDVARMAERAYTRISKILDHEFLERKPIILYGSHSEFQQTNLAGGEVDEGTGGFTDFLFHRNTFPMTGSYEEAEHVLQHEMTHQFQFDIWSRGRGPAGIGGVIGVNAPLWWGEGMAEYVSLGPVDAHTAMWLRDAALEGDLPSPQDFYRIFPYRFGHALVSYIGQRWGDEAIGAITKAATGSNIEVAVRRVTGLAFSVLVEQWKDAVQKQYLPEIGDRVKARTMATPLLTEDNSQGTWHLAPALSPDGSLVAYFSEKDFYFVDLYLADGNTGKPIRRLLKSSYSSNYETYRFINSSASWSPDGRFLAFAAKREGQDDLVIVDPRRNKEIRRIRLPVAGITTPTWSPDGTRLVFSGLNGGLSDLYTVSADGTNMRQLTNDRAADLHPAWSPDGRSIAFVTDRGPTTDFSQLHWENFKVALYDMETGEIQFLPGMEEGKNVSPQWSEDGRSIAFVSDRTGVNNIFLYELDDQQIYQISDFYTGVEGITSLSPALSWSTGSDRLAFVYFEQGKYDVYSVSSPRLLKKAPYQRQVAPTLIAGITGAAPATPALADRPSPAPRRAAVEAPKPSGVLGGVSVYRSDEGFRPTDSLGVVPDSLRGPDPVSIARILDSTGYLLPDTNEFLHRPYKVKFQAEYVSQPTIGYARDNFGRAVYGQATVVMGDMLGDQKMIFSTTLNGRLTETSFLAQYVNLKSRLQWTAGISQQPYYLYGQQGITDANNPNNPDELNYVTQYRRLIYRTGFASLYYPMNRFRRVEFGAQVVNVQDDVLSFIEPFDSRTGLPTDIPRQETVGLGTRSFVMPSVALVFDNSLSGWVGPLMGRRSRIEIAQSVGAWSFTQGTFDYRRYDRVGGPVVLATRLLYFGRTGRDAERFQLFAGNPELIRGHTYGSYDRAECRQISSASTGCSVNNLLGSQVAVFNAELRLPLMNEFLSLLPIPLPGFELAAFFDVGMVWNDGSTLKRSRDPGDPYLPTYDVEGNISTAEVRSPVSSWGFSARWNLLGFLPMRLEYTIPRNRMGVDHLWTLSLGPVF
jgi:Tol biopolymer transport system component